MLFKSFSAAINLLLLLHICVLLYSNQDSTGPPYASQVNSSLEVVGRRPKSSAEVGSRVNQTPEEE
jgi:hypothetical protein